MLADAVFSKKGFSPKELLAIIAKLSQELPTRLQGGNPERAAVWVRNDKGAVVVTCPECLRTFPVSGLSMGINEAECDFGCSVIAFEVNARIENAEAGE